LKNNKAPGLDTITNKMIKYSSHVMLPLITKVFNKIYISGEYPEAWSMGYITHIHKKGSTSNPKNYRGITITNALGKLFSSILNKRLQTFLDNNQIISKLQTGFEKGALSFLSFSSS